MNKLIALVASTLFAISVFGAETNYPIKWVEVGNSNSQLRVDVGPTRTLSSTSSFMAAGYYEATNLSLVSPYLVSQNIFTNITIFGIIGSLSVAESYQCFPSKTGWETSYATRDDGALQLGGTWPNPRFTVQADTNCVLDNMTGLIWARNANYFGATNWGAAITNCNNMSYGSQTDWRLPNYKEMASLIDFGQVSPTLCNTAGTSKWSANDPFTNVRTNAVGLGDYWTSTAVNNLSNNFWTVSLLTGVLTSRARAGNFYQFPVRGP